MLTLEYTLCLLPRLHISFFLPFLTFWLQYGFEFRTESSLSILSPHVLGVSESPELAHRQRLTTQQRPYFQARTYCMKQQHCGRCSDRAGHRNMSATPCLLRDLLKQRMLRR